MLRGGYLAPTTKPQSSTRPTDPRRQTRPLRTLVSSGTPKHRGTKVQGQSLRMDGPVVLFEIGNLGQEDVDLARGDRLRRGREGFQGDRSERDKI